MVFLVSKALEPKIDYHLTKYQYKKTEDGYYIRQKYTTRKYPIYKLSITHDQMDHNLLFTLTMETAPEKRTVKNDRIIFQKGTVIQEELARITRTLQ